MAQTPEGRVKDKVKKLLKHHDVWYFMPMQNGMGVVGIPDIIACCNGHFMAIETKAPGKLNNLSANQKLQLELIADAKGATFVTDGNLAEIEETIIRLKEEVTCVTMPFWSEKILGL